MALIQWRYKVSYILNVNTNGVRTRGMNPRELMQELTPSSPDYGKVKVGTDGTIGGEVTLAKDTEATTTTKGLMSAADKIKVDTIDDTITRQGNVFNGNSQLVQTTEDGKLPALDGSNLTGLTTNVSAADTSFDNTVSGLTATNVQDAVDELEGKINSNKSISVPASYHLLQGNLAVDNYITTQGFNTTLYTGNGSTQSINTGIDMDTQWGNDASEKYGGLVWCKTRGTTANHFWFDTARGVTKHVYSNLTNAETTEAASLTSFYSNGFTLGAYSQTNGNTATFASWNFQTTHRISGTTNHGKAYTCHYNPYTGFTIVKYEGSGIAGHEIPHHLGRKLGLVTAKNLSSAGNWNTTYIEDFALTLNTTNAESSSSIFDVLGENTTTIEATGGDYNVSSNQYILYGWANSYFDEANTLIGNYEVGIYQSTGVAGNKVTTRGKPAWVMMKRLDNTSNWLIFDNQRQPSGNDGALWANLSGAEYGSGNLISFNADGFTHLANYSDGNVAGGQYLYMVAYDTNSNGGGSYYPRATDNAQVQINNALIPLAKGYDSNGVKNEIVVANETITGITLTAGKNYIYRTYTGYGVSTNPPSYGKENPLTGDFFNLVTLKWYNSSNVEIEPRNYLDAIVHADSTGNPLYVEELPKTEYKDVIKANEYQGGNVILAKANIDMTTTPPTVSNSFNIDKVIRVSAGIGEAYFINQVSTNSSAICSSNGVSGIVTAMSGNKVRFQTSTTNYSMTELIVF